MRISIKSKMFIMYTLISLIVFISLNFVIVNQLKSYNRNVIKKDMLELYERTANYIGKDLDFNTVEKINSNNHYALKQLSTMLAMNFNEQIIIYLNNEIIAEFAPDYRAYEFSEISFNKNSFKTSYDINYFKDKAIVDFPIRYDGFNRQIIIRYFVDYTDMLQTEKQVKIIMYIMSVIASIIIIGLSMLSSNSIIKRILTIKAFTKKVVNNEFNNQLIIKSNDELGELAVDLNDMTTKLGQQITKIKNDRDEIKRISNYKKNFYDSVTHELKTPLTTIIGYSELLLAECVGRQEDIDSIKIINNESMRLYDLVKSILDISFYNEADLYNNKEIINLTDLIAKIVIKMNIKAQKYYVTLNSNVADNLQVYGNEGALRSLIVNLLDNSIKYNKINGSVTVIAFKENNYIKVIVEDTGIGIKEQNLRNIFKPFFKENRATIVTESSGLGLAVIENIIKSHDASIDIISELNKGTKVTVLINANKPNFY
ncbi:HAMP domain-containing histidine kinase [Clostridium sp. 'deep sea']|uniref:sensor histidine kinase n=1 Tax=Clostridium sp. 'deep sea' TaxID=2779445 RepID=UPI001896502B|nr:HAMP domain-containing sensor histidine kinase [Clostridium sp. 'deep sea']QOR35262.1 HAMP domain-containing histidine kinase [Clostridium sp. 'deep sea']